MTLPADRFLFFSAVLYSLLDPDLMKIVGELVSFSGKIAQQ